MGRLEGGLKPAKTSSKLKPKVQNVQKAIGFVQL